VRSRKLGDLGSFGVEDLFEELSRCSEIAEEMKLEGVKAEKVVEVKAVDVVTE
jgi:threonyl-tRNA synthetase